MVVSNFYFGLLNKLGMFRMVAKWRSFKEPCFKASPENGFHGQPALSHSLDVGRGAKQLNFSSSVVGLQPLNRNKQKCKMDLPLSPQYDQKWKKCFPTTTMFPPPRSWFALATSRSERKGSFASPHIATSGSRPEPKDFPVIHSGHPPRKDHLWVKHRYPNLVNEHMD